MNKCQVKPVYLCTADSWHQCGYSKTNSEYECIYQNCGACSNREAQLRALTVAKNGLLK